MLLPLHNACSRFQFGSLHALCFPTGQIDIPGVSLLRGDSTGLGLLRGKKVNVQ